MGRDLTFDNVHEHIHDFIRVENGTVDISAYSYVEPVGVAMLKAIKQEAKEVEINTLDKAKYDENKTYIPIEVVKSGNVENNREKIVNKIMHSFSN
ncbi:hypothetical protein [Hydrogenobaculum acidophilum]